MDQESGAKGTLNAWQVMREGRYTITPRAALIVASIVAVIAFAISTYISMQQPWLGISLAPAEKGLLIKDVAKEGPAAGILYAGDVIVEMADMQGHHIRLENRDIIEDPDAIPTLAERNKFRERQTVIYRILRQPVATLTLDDGREVRIQPLPSRPPSAFSFSFWVLSLYALIALLVGTAVWSVRQQSIPARYLLLSGVGAIVLLNSVRIIALRELVLDGALYPWLTFVFHLGNNLFAFGLIALMWHSPNNLGRFHIGPLLIAVMSFFMLNELFVWTELPGNSVLIQVPFYLVTGMVILAMQWHKGRGNPVDRAIVKVLMMMTMVLAFALTTVYFVNVVLFDSPKITQTQGFFGILLVFIMLSLAVIRYRLFNIDRWWLEIWLWFFAGVAIVAFDVALVTLANMAPSYALGISVIVAAWLYFPLRQWVWSRFFPGSRRNLEEYVPLLVTHLVKSEEIDTTRMWKQLLADVFRPLAIEPKPVSVSRAKIGEDGIRLYVPCLTDACCMELYYAEKGQRLFNSADIGLAQALFNISQSSLEQRESYARGMQDERKRIMRDLHDDVGGRLLTLTHSEQGKSTIAAEALKRLREIIYALDVEEHATLNTMAAKWRIEALERSEAAGIGFRWQWEEAETDVELSPRYVLNLTMILREALSNALTHARTRDVAFTLRLVEGELRIEVCNDGVSSSESAIKPGKGLANMRSRTEEMHGKFAFDVGDREFCVRVTLPVTQEGIHE